MKHSKKTQRQALVDFITVFFSHPDAKMRKAVAEAELQLSAMNQADEATEARNRGNAAKLVWALMEDVGAGIESEKEAHIIGLVAKGMSKD